MKRRSLWESLIWEKDQTMNLGQLFTLIMGLCGCAGFIVVVILRPASIPIQLAAFSFLASGFLSVLITAVPIARAKILSQSKLPGEVAHAIADIGLEHTTSTDVRELYQQKQLSDDEKG